MVGGARRSLVLSSGVLRVITLNVNGIRSAASKGLFRWLAGQRADVVCLQEMKCQEVDLDAKLHGLKVFQTCHAFAEKKGYSGVSLYSRCTPDEVRMFARLFGLHPPSDPTLAAAFRSVGARDVAVGMGLWSAAARGGNYAPWLLARAICDGGDTLAALIAIRAGARDPRFLGLTAMAIAASAVGVLLHRQAR